MQLEIQIYQENERLDTGVELVGTVRSLDNDACTLHAGSTGRLNALLGELNMYRVTDLQDMTPISYEAGRRYIVSLAAFYRNNRNVATIVLDKQVIAFDQAMALVYPDWETKNAEAWELKDYVQRQGSTSGDTGATGSASEGAVQEG